MTTSYNGHILKHATVEDFERWDSPSGALMTDEEYDRHFKRIRKMLVESGEYDDFQDYENPEGVLDTDTALIMKAPHLNPEFF
tara:strand:- start:591 stop:839 length:249 start_codon:yes stop_codon:yes gene_type:complete